MGRSRNRRLTDDLIGDKFTTQDHEEVTIMMGGMGLGLLLLLLLVVGVPLALLGGGALALLNRGSSRGNDDRSTAGETPREILDRRLARGEIDAEEHRKLLSAITNGGAL
jgi:uncharacterized membrane protein